MLNVLYPDTSFVMMMPVSMFGAMFTWLTIFVTHLFFRRHHRGQALAFRMTLFCGVPFMIVLSVVYAVWYRGKGAAPAGEREGVHAPGP